MILRRAKRFAAGLAVLSIALAPAAALAEEEGAERVAAIAFDVVILRPAGFVRFVLGSVIATVVLPFALISGQTEEVVETLIGNPGEFTFLRELGDF